MSCSRKSTSDFGRVQLPDLGSIIRYNVFRSEGEGELVYWTVRRAWEAGAAAAGLLRKRGSDFWTERETPHARGRATINHAMMRRGDFMGLPEGIWEKRDEPEDYKRSRASTGQP